MFPNTLSTDPGLFASGDVVNGETMSNDLCSFSPSGTNLLPNEFLFMDNVLLGDTNLDGHPVLSIDHTGKYSYIFKPTLFKIADSWLFSRKQL